MMEICVENIKTHEFKWFKIPVSLDKILEELGLENEEAYEIVEYWAPFDIDITKRLDLRELNRMSELWKENKGKPALDYLNELVNAGYFASVLDVLENIDKITVYEECYSVRDLGAYYIENGLLEVGKLPDIIARNINYLGIGKELIRSGNYYQADDAFIRISGC